MKLADHTTLAIAVTLLAVNAPAAQGQWYTPDDRRVDVPKAVQLEREAEVLQAITTKWKEAASLLRKAARLRPGSDSIALADLQRAGLIYANVGSHRNARFTLLELADRAETFGEIAMAAHALIDLAFVANAMGDAQGVRTYHGRAQRLVGSSHLSSGEREELAMRLVPFTNRLAARPD